MPIPETGVPVAGQPAQVGRPHGIGLYDHAVVPADNAAGGCGDLSLVPEVLVELADRLTVSDDALVFEHPAEQVGHMLPLLLPFGPAQLERPSVDPRYPDVAVGLDDVMARQPGLVDDVRPRGDRPPPAWKIALPPVRRRRAERFHPAKIEQRGFLKRNGAPPVTVIGIDKLDPIGQLAGLRGPIDMLVFAA